MLHRIFGYLKTHRSAILGTIVLLQNSGFLSEKVVKVLENVSGVLIGI
jgi:hypothetical protein